MKSAQFRRLIEEAIATRQPLDCEEFARLAAEADDEAFWRAQVDLDHAIWAWSARSQPVARRRVTARSWIAWGAAVAAGIGVVWLARPFETTAPNVRVEVNRAELPDAPVVAGWPAISEPMLLAPVVAPRPSQDRRLAEATATAERLAYAFQPVGEQVGSVVRLLIDAVPGSDVFAL